MSAATDNLGVAERAMNQKAVYWAVSDDLDDFGKPAYKPPVEIDCRWEDIIEEFIDPNGDRQVSKSKLIVDRDMDTKGILKLSEYNLTIEQDPWDNDDVWEIRQFRKIPNFRGTKYLREVYL